MSSPSAQRPSFHVVLLVVCSLQALAIFSQGALAGSFLSGTDGAVRFHEMGGWTALLLAVIQLFLLMLTAAGRRYGLWLLMSSVGIVLAEALQLGSGYGRFLRVHIPLAILLVGLLTWQIIWIAQHPRDASAGAVS